MSLSSLNSKLKTISDALCGIDGLDVYHYYAPDVCEAPYCEWMEDGEGETLFNCNFRTSQVITGMIHLYTYLEYDPNVDSIQEALEEIPNVRWSLNSVQYEHEINLIHYAWDFEVE